MIKTTRKTVVVLLVATLALSLAGCIPEKMFPPMFGESTATPEATQEPVLDPLDLDGNGSVSEFEKQIAAKNAPRDFPMPDGTVAQVDPTQPLPAEIRDVVHAETKVLVNVSRYNSNADVSQPALNSVVSYLNDFKVRTGRGLVLVWETHSAGEGQRWVMMASDIRQTPFMPTVKRSEMADLAATWAAARNYELIVHE